MPEYGSKLTAPVYIRGIGSRINSPSVGLYVDYVPYFEKAAFNFDFFDVKRIEVLRGPQGTLFGRNTMGGVVNIVTISPVDYQGSHFGASGGSYGIFSMNGGHYGKVSPKTAYSLASNYSHNNGFHTNQYNGTKVDKLNSLGLRNRIIHELSQKLTIENIAGYEISRQGGYPYALFIDSIGLPGPVSYNQSSYYNRDLFSDAFLLRYSGQNVEISSTSSFQLLSDKQGIDQDFTTDSLYFIRQLQHQLMFSQELIARYTGKNKYKWLFGAYAFYQSFNNSVEVDAYLQNLNYLKKYDHTIEGYALFHQSSLADFPFKNLVLTAGLRLDAEKDVLDYYYDRTLRGNYSMMTDSVYPALNSLELLPKFAVSYRLGSNNIYGVIARGYKTGGFNSTFERPEDLTFEPEYSWNYETGIKAVLFGRKLNADLAFFYIDWKNQQIYQTVPSGRGSMLKNAGHSVSRGVEFTARAQPLKGYELIFAYGFTDARFISYIENDNTSHNGNRLPYVPRNTVSVQAAREIIINGSNFIDLLRINILYKGNGGIFWDEQNSASQDYYGITDLKLTFGRKAVQTDIWIRNMLNTSYSAFYFEALGNKYAQGGKPVHFGINMSVKF
jgi:outer membrane receptor protein involved in Fe transport